MKKLFLIHILILAFISIKAQQFKPTLIDDSVQASLPPEFQKKDTLGQQIFSAPTQFGNILVVKTPDDPDRTPEIEKKGHLNAFYEDYVKKISGTSEGIISDEKDTTINKLIYKDFTLQSESGSGKQFRKFRIVHVNNATYTFQFLYKDIHQEYAKEEYSNFFNSIKIPPDASVASQFTNPENTTGTPPASSRNYLIGLIVGGIILILIIVFFLRRRRHHV
jgi:hypothetical protein